MIFRLKTLNLDICILTSDSLCLQLCLQLYLRPGLYPPVHSQSLSLKNVLNIDTPKFTTFVQ